MTEAIVFTIPHRLVRLNEYIRIERGNRYAAANTKKEQTGLCSWYVPKVKINDPIDVKMIWTVKNFANDPDNVSMGAKFILDAMVNRKMIPKDNLTMVKSLKHEFKRGKDEQVEVRVRRWEDGTKNNDKI